MKNAVFTLLHWTWGLSQNIVGGIGYLFLRGRHRHERYHGAYVTYVEAKNFGGVSLGKFIFMNPARDEGWVHDTRIHEFGHCVQSILLGPLYWPVVSIPSALWCNLPPVIKWRKKNNVSYYRLYCEGWANLWGSAWTGEKFATRELRARGRFGKPM
jgi:hypothetical protein